MNLDEIGSLRKRHRSVVVKPTSMPSVFERVSMSLPLMHFAEDSAVAIQIKEGEDPHSDPRTDPPVSSLSRMAYTRIFIALMIGTAFEWFDFSIYSGFGATISALFFPISNPGLQVRVHLPCQHCLHGDACSL